MTTTTSPLSQSSTSLHADPRPGADDKSLLPSTLVGMSLTLERLLVHPLPLLLAVAVEGQLVTEWLVPVLYQSQESLEHLAMIVSLEQVDMWGSVHRHADLGQL